MKGVRNAGAALWIRLKIAAADAPRGGSPREPAVFDTMLWTGPD